MSETTRQFEDSVATAKRYLDSCERAPDPGTALGYLVSAAEAVGSATAHLSHMPEVAPPALAMLRGLQDRLQASKGRYTQLLPVTGPRGAGRLKRRLT